MRHIVCRQRLAFQKLAALQVVGCDNPGGFLTKFLFLMLVTTAGIEAGAYFTLDTTYSNYILLCIWIHEFITSKKFYLRMACFSGSLAVSAFVLAKLQVLNDMWQHFNGYWHLAASSNLCFLLFLVVFSFSSPPTPPPLPTPPRTLILFYYCR